MAVGMLQEWVITQNIVHVFIRCDACRIPADLLKVQLSVQRFSIKFHHVHASPLKYDLTVVALVNTIINFEHMKDTQHSLPWYLICNAVFTHQQIMYRVPRGRF